MASINLKCSVQYDGTDFCGWQRQDNCRTIQGELEDALSRIAATPITIQGAGRTDAGVHALGQVFSCTWPGEPPKRLRHAINQMLKPDIRILSIEEVPLAFNARFDAVGKKYIYTFDLNRHPSPFLARYAWHVPYKVDLEAIDQCLRQIVGKHDFSGFQSAGAQMENTTRTLFDVRLCPGGWLSVSNEPGIYSIEMIGDGFLYKMVRNICGTILEVARGRFTTSFIEETLHKGGPFRGLCAPAHGLVLAEVYYKASKGIPS